MSRIDQAVKAWETNHGVLTSEPGTGDSIEVSSLEDYPVEVRASVPDGVVLAPSLDPPMDRSATDARPLSRHATNAPTADVKARLVTGGSNTISIEQYRRLAAVLHDEQAESQLKTVMITSAVPSEGKTLTVVNLALTLSVSFGRRVLVIDGDLRAPALHRLLNINNDRGLSEALRE